MEIKTRVPGRPDWTAEPLYQKLLEVFPTHLTALGVLDIPKLKKDLKVSHETIYKWLRKSKLNPDNARAIVALAEKTAAGLENYEPPVFEDFCPFF